MTSLIVGDKFVILFRKDFLPRMNMITQMVDTDTLSLLHLVDSVIFSFRDIRHTARLGVLPLVSLLPLGAVLDGLVLGPGALDVSRHLSVSRDA